MGRAAHRSEPATANKTRESTSRLLTIVYAKLFVTRYGSLISTTGASKDFKRAVLIYLLIRFLEQRSILVELSNREAKIETAQFDGIGSSQGVERPEPLFLAPENFNEGNSELISRYSCMLGQERYCKDFWPRSRASVVGREDFCHQRGIADDVLGSSIA